MGQTFSSFFKNRNEEKPESITLSEAPKKKTPFSAIRLITITYTSFINDIGFRCVTYEKVVGFRLTTTDNVFLFDSLGINLELESKSYLSHQTLILKTYKSSRKLLALIAHRGTEPPTLEAYLALVKKEYREQAVNTYPQARLVSDSYPSETPTIVNCFADGKTLEDYREKPTLPDDAYRSKVVKRATR